jgi:hypothetical protein
MHSLTSSTHPTTKLIIWRYPSPSCTYANETHGNEHGHYVQLEGGRKLRVPCWTREKCGKCGRCGREVWRKEKVVVLEVRIVGCE